MTLPSFQLRLGVVNDSAMAENFWAALEREVLSRRRRERRADAKMAISARIEGCYNPRRRHSWLDYRSPTNYEPCASCSCRAFSSARTQSSAICWLLECKTGHGLFDPWICPVLQIGFSARDLRQSGFSASLNRTLEN
jgi:hypothetical protein